MNTQDQESGTERDIMNVHEVAGYLRLSEAKIYKLARTGCIPAIRLGKTWRFRRSTIDEWICKESGENLKLTEERFSERLITIANNPAHRPL
jgi:excisionase family DNA binding protein